MLKRDVDDRKFKAEENDRTFESDLLADHGSCLIVKAVGTY